MTLFNLTYGAAIDACRKAWAEGRLGVQLPIEETRGDCLYRYKREGCGCAIGVALPDGLIEYGSLYNSDNGLIKLNKRVVDCGDDYEALNTLQKAHDQALNCKAREARHPDQEWAVKEAAAALSHFKALIAV